MIVTATTSIALILACCARTRCTLTAVLHVVASPTALARVLAEQLYVHVLHALRGVTLFGGRVLGVAAGAVHCVGLITAPIVAHLNKLLIFVFVPCIGTTTIVPTILSVSISRVFSWIIVAFAIRAHVLLMVWRPINNLDHFIAVEAQSCVLRLRLPTCRSPVVTTFLT